MSVKNDNPIGNLWNSITKEAGRAVNEAGRHVSESINEIATATEDGGLVAGAAKYIEKISPGNIVAGAIDSVIPGEDLPPALANGIAAGVNVFAGPFQIVAVYNAYQALSAGGGGSEPAPADAAAGRAAGGQRMQTPEKPSSARERAVGQRDEIRGNARREAIKEAKAEAKAKAVDKAQSNRIGELEARVAHLEELAGIQETRPGGGYGGVADDVDLGVGGGFLSNDFFKDEISGARGKGKSGNAKLDKLEKDLADANAEIEKILNNPNLAFEDMIFLLMKAVIKQSESEVKIGLEQEKGTRDADRGSRDAGRAAINGMQAELNAKTKELASAKDQPTKDKLQAEVGEIRGKIDAAQTELSDSLNDKTESRGERFEDLKESLQKIGEMQQALSNIMNALHQTAQNAIGNIR